MIARLPFAIIFTSLLASAAAPASAQITATITATYGLPTDNLPLPVSIPLAFICQCGSIGVGGLSYTVNANNGNSTADAGFSFDMAGAVTELTQMIVNEFQPPSLSVTPCCAINSMARITGQSSLYSFHIGPGGPFRQKIHGTINLTDSITVNSATATTIELPVSIHATLTAAESFGDPNATFARGWASLSGSCAGVSLGPDRIDVESISVIPVQASITQQRRAIVAVSPGTNTFPLTITGEFEIIAQAKSTGLFGSISGAATIGLTLPNSLRIEPFTGPGGGPLPAGTVIRSALTGAVYASTVPGDMDADGDLDADDIAAFVAAALGIADPVTADRADVNDSGAVDGADVQPLMMILIP